MSELVFKEFVYNEKHIMNLYLDNEWYAYTNDKESLFNAIKNSTECFGVYDGENLVAFARVVSDKYTMCYIQDILILRNYHRKGIGTKLMRIIIEKYKHCRQINLATDNTEKQIHFYESLGFERYDKKECVGFWYNHKSK